MGLFGHRAMARVTSSGAGRLEVARADGANFAIDLGVIDLIGFIHVGDEFSPVHEGWWLLAGADGGHAINLECGAIDPLMREGGGAAGSTARLVQIDVASRPSELRGRDARDGVAVLSAADVVSIQSKGIVIAQDSVRDFPMIL